VWIFFAFCSAVFAGLTAILSKIGIRNIDSNVATALRTIVVLIFSWIMVFIKGSQKTISQISGYTLLFLVLSGLATGASWLCYFRALQIGDVNKVTPIDKSSTILSMILAFILLGEEITLIKAAAIVLIGAGTYLMIQKSRPADAKPAAASDPGPDTGSAADAGMKTTGTGAAANLNSNGNNSDTDAGAVTTSTANTIAEAITAASAVTAANANTGGSLWLIYAAGSAVFASLTSILGKIGIEGVESNLGTAIRTIIVLIMAWLVVFVTKKQHTIRGIDKKSIIFLVLSGFATGGSWLCYYKALQDGPASIVVPIDKMSIVVTVAFSSLFLKEKLTFKSLAGLALITAGTLSLLI